jgi:MFS family permease
MIRPAALWRHHDFVRLWTAAAISVAGTQVTLLALPLTAILVLHASAFEVAALATAATVPNLVLGIAAGIWLDRVQRRQVVIAADFARVVVLASVPLAYVFGVLGLPQL